jgi:hypothetical protein
MLISSSIFMSTSSASSAGTGSDMNDAGELELDDSEGESASLALVDSRVGGGRGDGGG